MSVVELLVVVVLHDQPDEVVVDQAQTETKYTFINNNINKIGISIA